MESRNIYTDIARRTGGDIYIGVVGPVRTGKSTFIKRFMEDLVIPNIESEFLRERAVDELPQSAAGTHHHDHRAEIYPRGGGEDRAGTGRPAQRPPDRLRGLHRPKLIGLYRKRAAPHGDDPLV